MTDILQIFSGNPLSTFIGKKIESATRPELESEDWALNLEICDIINENDDDAKDAVRAIKKRLQPTEHDRNFTITNRTLTVLETCVSNCSRRFHVHVMTKDFIQDLVKLIGPKNNPPIELQERVLRLIERWAEAFRSQPDLSGVVAVYNDLKAKGVTFPPKDPNSNVPIQTPQRSVPPPSSQPTELRSTTRRPLSGQSQLSPQPSGQVVLEGEGYNKISQDLTIVQSSIEMFDEIIRVLESPSNDESDWKLAADLNATCRQMKDRIVDLIERVANEDLTIELLRLNDELNNIFTKYDRLVKNHSKVSNQQTVSGSSNVSASADSSSQQSNRQPTPTSMASNKVSGISSKTVNELSLIDFNAVDSAAAVTAPVKQATTNDPFDTSQIIPKSSNNHIADSFNRLNLGSNEVKTDTTSASAISKQATGGLPEEISSVREQDFAEIENWLSTNSGRNLNSIDGDQPSIEPISIPNSEFDNFIATRALANPATTTPATTNPQQTNKPPTADRQPEPST